MKNVLITGNLGYIGPVMTRLFKEKGYLVTGLDSGLYLDCFMDDYVKPYVQLLKDIRDINIQDLNGIDFIVHLAGLSNDPLGELEEKLTYEINFDATIRLAELGRRAGVKRFVYASSQSVYGISSESHEVDENSLVNPITAYAKSKLKSELGLLELSNDVFTTTILRPGTAYGKSPNLRYDIVLNAFVANAHSTGEIIVKSDGKPWRPMSHIEDICSAFIACIEAPLDLIKDQVFNVGTKDNNYTVKELAAEVVKQFANSKVVFTNEHIDSRSYRVSSEKILTVLKGFYHPKHNIITGVEELKEFFNQMNVRKTQTKNYGGIRLKRIKHLISTGKIDSNLRFLNKG
jgi:nucleoside-diphosphate-sugar epimerase